MSHSHDERQDAYQRGSERPREIAAAVAAVAAAAAEAARAFRLRTRFVDRQAAAAQLIVRSAR